MYDQFCLAQNGQRFYASCNDVQRIPQNKTMKRTQTGVDQNFISGNHFTAKSRLLKKISLEPCQSFTMGYLKPPPSLTIFHFPREFKIGSSTVPHLLIYYNVFQILVLLFFRSTVTEMSLTVY